MYLRRLSEEIIRGERAPRLVKQTHETPILKYFDEIQRGLPTRCLAGLARAFHGRQARRQAAQDGAPWTSDRFPNLRSGCQWERVRCAHFSWLMSTALRRSSQIPRRFGSEHWKRAVVFARLPKARCVLSQLDACLLRWSGAIDELSSGRFRGRPRRA